MNILSSAGLKYLRVIKYAGYGGGAVTNSTIVYVTTFSEFYAALEVTWLSAILAGLCVLLVLGLIDAGQAVLDIDVVRFWANRQPKPPRQRNTMGVLLLILLLCKFATVYLSWHGREFTAHAVVKRPQALDISAIAGSLNNQYDPQINALTQQIKDLERRKRDAVKAVNNRYPMLVECSAKPDDKWCGAQLQKHIDKATTGLDQSIARLEDQKGRMLEDANNTKQAATRQAMVQDDRNQQDYKKRMDRSMNLIGYFGVGCTVLATLCAIVLGLVEMEEVQHNRATNYIAPSNEKRAKKIVLHNTYPHPDSGVKVYEYTDYDGKKKESTLTLIEAKLNQNNKRIRDNATLNKETSLYMKEGTQYLADFVKSIKT